MYPDVLTNPIDSIEILKNLAGSFLYKDILELGGIRRPEILLKLLQAPALQIGNEVSTMNSLKLSAQIKQQLCLTLTC